MMSVRLLPLLLGLLWQVSTAQVITLPLSEYPYKPLRQNLDQSLTKELHAIVDKHPRWRRLAKAKKLSIGLVDISNPASPRFAHVNGDEMLYAASLPKIAILLAVVDAIDKGELASSPEIDDMMHRMINVSSNDCATKLMDLVGYEKIEEVLKANSLYDQDEKGGLWVGKRYGQGGARYPDPIKGLSHAASATQVCRFYYMLAYGQMINCERSQQMLDYLVDPHLHHKFVSVLDNRSPDATVYRKSGTWRTYHSDSVMVIGQEWRSYILVALVDDTLGETIIRNLIQEVDTALQRTQ